LIRQRDAELKGFIDSQTRALLRELAEEGERRNSEFDVVAVELKKTTMSEWDSPAPRSDYSPENLRKGLIKVESRSSSKSEKSTSPKLEIIPSKSAKGQRKSERSSAGNSRGVAAESSVSNGNLAAILDEPFLDVRILFAPPEGTKDLLGAREAEGNVVGIISVLEKHLGILYIIFS